MAKNTDTVLQEAYFAAMDGLWFGACQGQISATSEPCKICKSKLHYAFDCADNPIVLWMHRKN